MAKIAFFFSKRKTVDENRGMSSQLSKPLVREVLDEPGLFRRVVSSDCLSWSLSRAVRDAGKDDLIPAGNVDFITEADLALVRGLLLYGIDDLPPAHAVFQEDHTGVGSYTHGMLHRREGDFDNARYWFRRAGKLGFFSDLHGAASRVSANMGRQVSWDPYLLTGLCEQASRGDEVLRDECRALVRAEWECLLFRLSGVAQGE